MEKRHYYNGTSVQMELVYMEQLCDRYEAFISESSAKSLAFVYWSMYIKMIGKLLGLRYYKCI